jgi:hypothetical protein
MYKFYKITKILVIFSIFGHFRGTPKKGQKGSKLAQIGDFRGVKNRVIFSSDVFSELIGPKSTILTIFGKVLTGGLTI